MKSDRTILKILEIIEWVLWDFYLDIRWYVMSLNEMEVVCEDCFENETLEFSIMLYEGLLDRPRVLEKVKTIIQVNWKSNGWMMWCDCDDFQNLSCISNQKLINRTRKLKES